MLAIVTENDVLIYEEYFQIRRICILQLAKHVNYLQIRVEPEQKAIKDYIYRTLLGEGKQTVGGPPPTPALKNLKDKLTSRGDWGRTKGKRKGSKSADSRLTPTQAGSSV